MLSNQEHDILNGHDYFDVKPKANAIKTMLELPIENTGNAKMYALYGDWGSGKSTILKYIRGAINKEMHNEKSFNKTVFFNAWENENDTDLFSSLLFQVLEDNTKNIGDDLVDLVKKAAFPLVKGIANTIVNELGLTQITDAYKKAWTERDSFSLRLKKFKQEFIKIENAILEKEGKLIVFIDDLDRCEPEKVLDLIAAIKVFFTLGEKTVFIFGVDKIAVQNAIKTRYSDVVKSEEYLEKIFDISFNVPPTNNISGLIDEVFPTILFTGRKANLTLEIQNFFNAIGYVNPRKVKKILNKYEILNLMNNTGVSDRRYCSRVLFHKEFNKDVRTGSLFETICTLFIIVLYEFENENFTELENYEFKKHTWIKFQNEWNRENTSTSSTSTSTERTFDDFILNSRGFSIKEISSPLKLTFTELSGLADTFNKGGNFDVFFNFVMSIFYPESTDPLGSWLNNPNFYKTFSKDKNKAIIGFIKYVRDRKEFFFREQVYSEMKIHDLFKMARLYL